jgi:hypothetical protein
VSREFVEASAEALRTLCERRFEGAEFLILYIDGVHAGGQLQELRELRPERLQSTSAVSVDNTAATPLTEEAA